MTKTRVSSLKDNLYIYALSAYMFLLGSHLLVHYQWIFILPALLLVDWKKKFPIEIYFLFFFLISLYGVYIYGHRGIFHHGQWAFGVITEIVMIFLVYLLGVNLKNINRDNISNDRKVFYLLYGFFIAYALGIVYSLYFLPQNNLLSPRLMVQYYTYANDPHVYNGRLAKAIVAYFLPFLIVLIPLIIFNLKKFREIKFSYIELLFVLLLGIFSVYTAFDMGRRLSLLLLILFSLLYILYAFYSTTKKYNIYYSFALFLITILVSIALYYTFIEDSPVIYRIKINNGFTDSRHELWLLGLKYMWQYPFGGAAPLPIFNGDDPNAHNLWVNIGKYYGVAAFVASILLYLIHVKYFVRIMWNKSISLFMKNIIFIIAFVLFANMMVESIFHTEKSLFLYSIFFLGFMKFYSDSYSDKLVKE